MIDTPTSSLLGLLQLSSPNLPVGAFSYSQGLESAVEDHLVRDEESALTWIDQTLGLIIGRYDAPLWLRLHAALAAQDWPTAADWNVDYLASRETHELVGEARQMGFSAVRWLETLDLAIPPAVKDPAFITVHAWACTRWDIAADHGLPAYLYTWAENQVMAALKLVPLGQSAGQRLLRELRSRIAEVSAHAALIADQDLGNQAPGFALQACRHESQYSRLFRS